MVKGSRAKERITRADLDRLSDIARADRDEFFKRPSQERRCPVLGAAEFLCSTGSTTGFDPLPS
jgi:hypothetical protein